MGAAGDVRFEGDTLIVNARPSVQAWEAPIQKALVAHTVRSGDVVVEIGYGLGMASAEIQGRCPRAHWIVEPYPDVFSTNLPRILATSTGVMITRWQDVLQLLRDEVADAIVYDADPELIPDFSGTAADHFLFVKDILQSAPRLLAKGGRLGFIDFSGGLYRYREFAASLKHQSLKLDRYDIKVEPSPGCCYAKEGMGNIIIITKI